MHILSEAVVRNIMHVTIYIFQLALVHHIQCITKVFRYLNGMYSEYSPLNNQLVPEILSMSKKDHDLIGSYNRIYKRTESKEECKGKQCRAIRSPHLRLHCPVSGHLMRYWVHYTGFTAVFQPLQKSEH